MTVYYSKDHEWIRVEGNIATIGITTHAVEQLGEIVFIEQKDSGETFKKGEEMGVVESVKAASEIYAPIDCELIENNGILTDDPGKLNETPESDSWICRVKVSDPSQLDDLMDFDAYQTLIA